MRRILSLVLCFQLIFATTSAWAGKEYVLLAEDDWYPFSGVIDKANKSAYRAEGMSIDIITAAYEATGNTVRYITMPYAKCMSEVQKGNADGCFNSSMNSRREIDFMFPKFSMFATDCAIYELATASAPQEITIANLRSGVVVALTAEYEYGVAIDSDPRINKFISVTDAESMRAVIDGRAKYALLFSATVPFIYKQYPELAGKMRKVGFVNQDENYVVYSRKLASAEESKKVFELGITIIRRNGVYHRILNKYRESVK